MASKKKPLPRSLKLKSLAGGAPMCGNPLRFTMQPQQQTQWCWAAVSVSINLFYHPASGRTQCAVANTAMGQTTCCQDGSSAQCNAQMIDAQPPARSRWRCGAFVGAVDGSTM